MTRIAIVGMACRYPDAVSPQELWDNVLAGRRAFRRLPDERMCLADYWAPDPGVPDRFYASNAAVIEGYEFDRVAYRIAGSTYRATDLTHWLALDMAAQALADAGFPAGEGLPRSRTGVVVGNTLTGEFTRANTMRVRWPFVRRTVAAALAEQGWDDERLGPFLSELEYRYKSPFPEVDEDTLAGGLSNTIAGRICNYFDLKGGGYTVDGACSSSLLSVVTACRSLVDYDLDVAVAGGVDLSIDPFEIVGFAKAGALARGEMLVYDRGSNGFWPGEGCGMVTLMRESEAISAGHRIYATVAGWGISSDGKGGITRPEEEGYRLALDRAYRRAGFGPDTVAVFEGHGTGTEVGDATELRALSAARREADVAAPPAAIGSIKATIGHTKAAAGIAGLIKATMAVNRLLLPPTTGCRDPHSELSGESPALRVLRKAEPWPAGAPARAGITAMGFGGINTHVVLEGPTAATDRARLGTRERALASSVQDAELLLLDGESPAALRERLTQVAALVPQLSYAQLADLSATLRDQLADGAYRAAAVVHSPAEAQARLTTLGDAVSDGHRSLVDASGGVFLGHAEKPPRIGLLFPGQGSGRGISGGALRRRFAEAENVYLQADLPTGTDVVATAVAQPRIVTGSMAALAVLRSLGVEATVAVGHSLGEITALHWAGAIDAATLLRIATERGRAMTAHSRSGVMASIAAPPEVVERLLGELPVVIAGYNGPEQTVISGASEAVQRVCRSAGEVGLDWARLAVSHAFHSPLVAPAADGFGEWLTGEQFSQLRRRVISTVTGEALPAGAELPGLLRRQITDPVRFAPALATAAAEADLLVEVGPGTVLTGLARKVTTVPAVAIDTDNESLARLLSVVGAAYVRGASIAFERLWAERLVRPFALDQQQRFFASPCEEAPQLKVGASTLAPAVGAAGYAAEVAAGPAGGPTAVPAVESAPVDTLELLRALAAERAELPVASVSPESGLLDDLHLSSISVGQVMNQAASELGLPAAQAPANLATATLRELAAALDTLAETAQRSGPPETAAAGVAEWVRPFAVEHVVAPLTTRTGAEPDGAWQAYHRSDHPFAEPLRQALERSGVGSGVLVCLPSPCEEQDLELVLAASQAAVTGPPSGRLVLVQYGPGGTGLAKTAHLEMPGLRTTIVDTPAAGAVARVLAEVAATDGFVEVSYDQDGVRRTPVLCPMPMADGAAGQIPLDGDDVLLVTGGGKGITAECARALASDSGARLALLGRSDPGEDAELAGNLDRMRHAGITVHYASADVTDAEAVRRAVAEIRERLGPVTAVLHGAGRNEPASLTNLDMKAVREAFAPKLDGLRAVLAAVDPSELSMLVTFGSIIGRAGLRGEGHYAAANDWLAAATRELAEELPRCHAVCLEWSVWSGVGMGERLSVVETLLRDGVVAVSPHQGIEALRALLAVPDTPAVVVVTGRAEGLDTIRYASTELPLLRFVERPLVHYPAVELVTEVELSTVSDPYLDDHLLDGNMLLPAVLGMEAMAQVATALRGAGTVSALEKVEFLRPVVVSAGGATTVRVAALVTGENRVEVAIRSSETGFGADHFRATLHFDTGAPPAGPPEPTAGSAPLVPLEPGRDLYGEIAFQGKRFHRLLRYRYAAARRAEADVATGNGPWFSAYLPGELLLGDPGMRDSLMHGLQVCVPDATLLPVGVERIWPSTSSVGAHELTFAATEREHEGDTYVYDIAVRDGAGAVVERWDGLRLHAVRKQAGRGPWPPALLGPVLQRNLDELLGGGIEVAVEPDAATRRENTLAVLRRVLGTEIELRYRSDGKPEVDGASVSAAHTAGVTMGVARRDGGILGCDAEVVSLRPTSEWTGLLGRNASLADLLVTEAGDQFDTAATRIWCATECLQKAGGSSTAPLTLDGCPRPGWTTLAAGRWMVATFVTTLRGHDEPVVFAVLGERKV